MSFQSVTTHRLVKSEDLNHHGTLFAGRMAEWFVEAGFLSAAVHLPADSIVCVKIHGMSFSRSVHLGDIIRFDSCIVYSGNTSVISKICVSVKKDMILDGFITFVNVDKNGNSQPHGLEIVAETVEEKALQAEASKLRGVK